MKLGLQKRWYGRGDRVTDVYHHVVHRHQVEVEVWPARATVNFQDERWTNPINTQIRFEARVYNSSADVEWEVRNPAGGPGAGSIDATGLYRAPPKGVLASGATDVVVATASEDPLRKAFAWVTLIGEGPEPPSEPVVIISPKRVSLYYQTGDHNAYIDASNKMRMLSATLQDTPTTQLEWLVNNFVSQTGTSPWFLYHAPLSGGGQEVTVRVRLQGQPAIFDDAKVTLLNYSWPGLL